MLTVQINVAKLTTVVGAPVLVESMMNNLSTGSSLLGNESVFE